MVKIIKIIAIDSEEIILKSIAKALKSNNQFEFKITAASTAIEGLKTIRSDKFDIAIIDQFLPGMDSSELLRRIKNISSGISVVVMTGSSSNKINADIYDEDKFKDDNVITPEGFLLKPFTTEEIRSLVNDIILKKHIQT